ncbi:hypothetical protein J2Z40_002297 [Cytobacillus eiseniae]|uniref:Tyr recombinase domain-containing protein n=2 Tax=Cytobacillus TaxID=2675230 RepID=A0ABS4RH85_9BACI|nr:hypothetical protein [Cytobacillus eiseniae]MBP2241725.1 hypothetical protein [Cytobacillus eiseniae]
MEIDKVGFNHRLVSMLNDLGFHTVEELVELFNKMGYEGINKDLPLPSTDDPDYMHIKNRRRDRLASFKKRVVPRLIELGYIEDLPSPEQIEQETGRKLLGIVDAAKIIKCDPGTLEQNYLGTIIKETSYIVAYEDFLPHKVQQKYLFFEDDLKEISSRYAFNLTEIASELNINSKNLAQTLKRKLSDEEMKFAQLNMRHWNKEWIVNNIEEIISRKNKSYLEGVDYTIYFSNQLNSLIDSYFKDRLKGVEIEFDGKTYFPEPIKKETAAKRYRGALERYFYKVLCGRAGIENYWGMVTKNSFRELMPEEEARIRELNFDLSQFESNDLLSIYKGLKSDGSKKACTNVLKPFLYYYLMKREEEYYEKLERSYNESFVFDSKMERDKLFLMKRRFDKALKNETPTKASKPLNPRVKFYGTRKDIVECFKTLLRNEVGAINGGLRFPIKSAAVMLTGFLTGIRPLEMIEIDIDKHLDIEKDPNHPDFGFLKKYLFSETENDFVRTNINDPEGWSRLWIDEEISKGTYSPSPEYGTIIVPRLADFLNYYLRWLYGRQLSKFDKGKGYLFRSDERIPSMQYRNPNSLTTFIRRWRHEFPFLDPEEVSNFAYYETRHTVNNLIINKTLIRDPQINEWKVRVAEIHCRHSIGNDQGFTHSLSSINKEHYQEAVPLKIYYSVLKNALDFPFEHSKLIKWEKVNNPLGVAEYKGKDLSDGEVMNEVQIETEEPIQTINEVDFEAFEALNLELQKNKEMLQTLGIPRLAKKEYGLEKKDRLSKIEEVKKIIANLENDMDKLKERSLT